MTMMTDPSPRDVLDSDRLGSLDRVERLTPNAAMVLEEIPGPSSMILTLIEFPEGPRSFVVMTAMRDVAWRTAFWKAF